MRVGCWLGFEVTDPATIVLRVAPASVAGARLDERFEVVVDGRPLGAEHVDRIEGAHGGIVHVLRVPLGNLAISYEAAGQRGVPNTGSPASRLDVEQLTYLAQSRYCPSDLMNGFSAYELGHLRPGPELLDAVAIWVGSRLTYEGGASGPLDTAVDSLLAGRGVCRDFAHLAITVLRALEVPARFVSVYAPGLSPMDFHAVVEAHVGGRWQVVDPTRMAPRQALVRVATGRDAADTAFVTVLGGDAELQRAEVSAVVDGDLPVDDHVELLGIA